MFNQVQVRETLAAVCKEFDALIEHLRSLGHFQWIVNPGNAGDGVIAAGTARLFDQAGVSYHVTTRDQITPGMTAVYGGGGAWCRAFGIAPEIVAQVAPIAGSVVVLPSTFEREKLAIISRIPRIFLYGRDHHSVDLAREAGFPTAFAPDLAFQCPIPPVADCGGAGVLAAFRKDVIGTPHVPTLHSIRATKNQDLSRDGSHHTGDQLLREVSRYDVVHTDRLHVAIAGAMTGCDTTLYPNGQNYRKNVDLYAATLARFPNCRLHSDVPSSPASPRIQIVIPHCPGRDEQLCNLLKSLDESDWPVDQFPPMISYDHRRNQARNGRQALQFGIDTGAEFILQLENDVLVNRHLWENLIRSPHLLSTSCLTLYGCVRPYTQIDEHLRRIAPENSWGAQAILLRRSTAEYCVKHWERVAQYAYSDLRIFRLAAEVGPLEMHSPSLVQHAGRQGATAFHEVADFDPDWRRPTSDTATT